MWGERYGQAIWRRRRVGLLRFSGAGHLLPECGNLDTLVGRNRFQQRDPVSRECPWCGSHTSGAAMHDSGPTTLVVTDTIFRYGQTST